jgi:hypothetical protein
LRACFPFESQLNRHLAAQQLLAVQLFDGGQGIHLTGHGNKAKSTGITRTAVGNYNGFQDGASTDKKVVKILLSNCKVKAPHIKFIIHR